MWVNLDEFPIEAGEILILKNLKKVMLVVNESELGFSGLIYSEEYNAAPELGFESFPVDSDWFERVDENDSPRYKQEFQRRINERIHWCKEEIERQQSRLAFLDR